MTRLVRRQSVSESHRDAARDLRRRQTPAERRLWDLLRAGRLDGHRFRRQQPIGPYIADFYCAAARLIVELDGAIHEAQVEYDRERDAYLAAHDLRVLRLPNAVVLTDPAGAMRTIRAALAMPPPLSSRERGAAAAAG